MIQKWLKRTFALVLALMLPLCALADTQHTLALVPGDLLSSEAAIADLMNTIEIRVTEGEKSGALTLLLGKQPVVTIGLAADPTGLYAGSELLGEDILYLSWADAFAWISDFVYTALATSGADEAVFEAIDAAIAEAQNTLSTGMKLADAAQTPAVASMEESLAAIEMMFPDDPQMAAYVKGLYEDMTIEDGIFADDARDTADQKYRMAMDAEDLLVLCDTAYMKNTVLEALALEMPEASEAELAAAADELMIEVKKLYEESGFEMIMDMYTLDAGATLVGLDMSMKMTIEEGEQKSSMQMTANYDRLTSEDGVSHQANGDMTVDGETVKALFDLYQNNASAVTGKVGILAGGEEILVLYNAENTAADTRVRTADLYLRSNATAILEPSASDRPLIGISLTSEPAPEETLAALEQATAETSVNILKLSEAEMQNLLEEITMNATQAFYDAFAQLPTSTLSLLAAP